MSAITVVGAGYVGLTSAACFAHLGHSVTCTDVDGDKVRLLAKGELSMVEDGLPELVKEGLISDQLRFVRSNDVSALDADFVFLCVPTPQAADGSADLSIIDCVTRQLAPAIRPGTVLVVKSTAPVGTTARIAETLRKCGAPARVGVASNPEFLREGHAVRDFLHPSRIVIGSDDPSIADRVAGLYGRVDAPIILTDPASAEMIKYASNAFLATKVSFVNALANLCEAVDADVREVATGMGYDPRIGFGCLQPGPGWGGSCFPKDTAALLHTAERAGYDFGLLRGAIEVNDAQRERIVDKVRSACGGKLAGARIAVWGLAFKRDTDDLRESPAVDVACRLMHHGARVRAFDPVANEGAAQLGFEVTTDAYDACAGADALVILTDWPYFRAVEFERVRDALAAPEVVDARNLLDPTTMKGLGFSYQGVGR